MKIKLSYVIIFVVCVILSGVGYKMFYMPHKKPINEIQSSTNTNNITDALQSVQQVSQEEITGDTLEDKVTSSIIKNKQYLSCTKIEINNGNINDIWYTCFFFVLPGRENGFTIMKYTKDSYVSILFHGNDYKFDTEEKELIKILETITQEAIKNWNGEREAAVLEAL